VDENIYGEIVEYSFAFLTRMLPSISTITGFLIGLYLIGLIVKMVKTALSEQPSEPIQLERKTEQPSEPIQLERKTEQPKDVIVSVNKSSGATRRQREVVMEQTIVGSVCLGLIFFAGGLVGYWVGMVRYRGKPVLLWPDQTFEDNAPEEDLDETTCG